MSIRDKEITSSTELSSDTNIWKVEEKEIEEKLNEQLPEIKKVEVKIQFPNTVVIKIQELKRIAYISKGKCLLPVLENGKVLKKNKRTDLPLNAPIFIQFYEDKVLKK